MGARSFPALVLLTDLASFAARDAPDLGAVRLGKPEVAIGFKRRSGFASSITLCGKFITYGPKTERQRLGLLATTKGCFVTCIPATGTEITTMLKTIKFISAS
jgi:hypothetical protein